MSKTIDINSDQGPKRASKAKGGLSRTLFTLAIAVAICLSVLSFLWVLERTTRDTASHFEGVQRTDAQIFRDALSIPQKSFRLSALRNFQTAYPNSREAAQAAKLAEELEAQEYESWLSLSDIFYTTTVSREDQLDAANHFMQEWGGGTYQAEITFMLKQLEEEPALDTQKIAPIREQRQAAPQIDDSATTEDVTLEDMAGAAPIIEIYKPAALLPLPAIEPVIVAADISEDVQPTYPSRARTRGEEAVVIVSMDVGADGKVKDAYIVKSATGRYANDFGRAAIRAAERTRFTPKTIDGKAAPTNGFTRRYRFEIEDD